MVTRASATSRAAPRAEFADPFRSRVATITGADDGGGRGGQQRVQSLDPGVAVAGALLGVAVGRPDRVVDIDERHLRAGADQRGVPGQAGQEPGGDRVQLPDMAEPERPQERAQRRRRPHPGEQPAHPAVPQHGHIRNRIRAGDHARDQRGLPSPRPHARRRRAPSDAGPPASISPARAAKPIAGTSPACDTRLGSSNTADRTGTA